MNDGVVARVKPGVRGLSPYVVKELDYEVINMDKNENPFDLPAEMKKGILDVMMQKGWSRYPPIVPLDLYRRIAKYAGWRQDGVVVGNGSDELIMTFMTTFMGPGKKLVIPTPSFPMFKYMGILGGAEIVEVPLNDDYSYDCDALERTFIDGGGDMLIICSPNNPTGGLFPADRIEPILKRTDAPVVVDEAYFEFSRTTAMELLNTYDNLIIFRTFSKAFSLAGLRIGYALMAPALATEVGKVKLPFNLDFFSIVTASTLLESPAAVLATVDKLRGERDRVYAAMGDLPGVTAYETHANFILFRTVYDSAQVFEKILGDGILVRDLSAHPLLKNTLRVTVSRPEDNDRFLASLTRAVGELAEGR